MSFSCKRMQGHRMATFFSTSFCNGKSVMLKYPIALYINIKIAKGLPIMDNNIGDVDSIGVCGRSMARQLKYDYI